MRTKTSRQILIAVAAVLLLAVGAAVLWCGAVMPARAQGQTLDGFTSPGASVFVATDGSGEKQMRFEVRLTAGAAEGLTGSPEEETLDSGMIVLPYDLYTANDVTELTLDTPGIRTADLTRYWEATDGGYTSYAYIPADIVPAGQENRVLVARGYIRDGDTVYYTDEVKASMAYVAWQSLSALPEYEAELKAYMGPYTLTYGDDAAVCFTGYYGEPLAEIPMTAGGYNVLAWYWDEARTAEIAKTDYITGSMRIYPRMATYSVSGTISCADPAFDGDYTNVTVYVDGAETQTEVDPDGGYTLSLEAGPHEITFLAGVYGASKEISVNGVTELDASLADWTWKIGDYGTFASVGGVYDADDALDGSLTVSTSGEHYSIVMPNTATAAAAEYVVTTSELSFGSGVSEENKDNHYFGFGLTNGTHMLSFTFSRWSFVRINLNTSAGDGEQRVWTVDSSTGVGFGQGERTYRLIRTADEIRLYINDVMIFTLTADSITAGTGVTIPDWEVATDIPSEAIYDAFFGTDVELAFGLATTQVAPDATVTYEYTMTELVEVTGTIACEDESLDLSATELYTSDGVGCDIEIDAESGAFTALVPTGAELFFLNGVYGASARASGGALGTVTLADWTWKIGDYGTFASVGGVYDADDALDGSLTVSTSGEHYSIVMPNTATAAAAEYVVTTSKLSFGSDVSDGNKDNHYFGFGLSDGTSMLSFTVSRWHFLGVNMATLRGTGNRTVYSIGDAVSEAGSGSRTYKLVRTADAMMLYVNDALVLTLTADGITAGNGVSFMWNDENGVTSAAQYAGYFDADTELAFGLATTQVAPDATVTYEYTMTELVEVTGTIACEDKSLDLSATEVQVDGLKTMATVSADGQFSVSVVPGTKHTLTFTNGVYGAEVVLPVGTDTAEAELVDRTWKIGDYGTFVSVGDVYNADDVLDGSFTVTTDSAHYAIAMPNTATTEAMEYTITMSAATGTSDDQYFGFGLTNGTHMLSFTFSRWSFVRINLNTSAGDGEQRVWTVDSSTGVGFGQGERTYRLIRTADEIRLYINDVMIFTLTADSITAGTGVTITNWATTDIPSLAIYDAFFGTDVELALGFTTTGTPTAGASRTYTVSMEPYTETAEETEQ